MQLCNVEVRLGDSAGHTVRKEDITPAEILVLRAIHGEAAVVDINPTKMVRRQSQEEWERLQITYGRAPAGLTDAGNGKLLEQLFPGAQKNLPATLKDIGLGELMNPHREKEEEANGADA